MDKKNKTLNNDLKILTILSNFNEEHQLLNCFEDFNKNATIKSDLLVIDNASTDNSIRIITENRVDYIRHPANSGGGAGVIKTAFTYCYMKNYDIYCHMDADFQHRAEDLEAIVNPILKGESNIVFGSRYIIKKGFQSFFVRRIGIILFSMTISKITGFKLTDITNGLRAYDRKAIEIFAKKFTFKYEVCIELCLLAYYAGLKIIEVPMIMRPRITGKSEINFVNALKFPFYGIISLIGIFFRKIYRS